MEHNKGQKNTRNTKNRNETRHGEIKTGARCQTARFDGMPSCSFGQFGIIGLTDTVRRGLLAVMIIRIHDTTMGRLWAVSLLLPACQCQTAAACLSVASLQSPLLHAVLNLASSHWHACVLSRACK